jgi:hypothetical protein
MARAVFPSIFLFQDDRISRRLAKAAAPELGDDPVEPLIMVARR